MTSNDVFTKLAEKFDDGQIVAAPMDFLETRMKSTIQREAGNE